MLRCAGIAGHDHRTARARGRASIREWSYVAHRAERWFNNREQKPTFGARGINILKARELVAAPAAGPHRDDPGQT